MDFEGLQARLEELIREMDYVKEGLVLLQAPPACPPRQYENVTMPGVPGTLRRALPSRKIAFCSVCNKPSLRNDHRACITQGFKSNRPRWEASLFLASVD